MAEPSHPMAGAPELRIFDGLLPFFVDHPPGTVNWSKIPFAALEREGVLDPERLPSLLDAFDRHVAAMADLGYNAIAIDDLAHLVPLPCYDAALCRKLASYDTLYTHIFATARQHGLRVFAISDFFFSNPAIEQRLQREGLAPSALLAEIVATAFDRWPGLDGLVLRIGESDGVDVVGDFPSRLAARTPAATRALLQTLLPAFEARGKTLIFRTWTLGAYDVGDLIWNPRTYDQVFGGIASPSLVISLKYGAADFFRFLELNPLFFHGPHRKIVEMQCRREYEGMGEYPAFVGYLYARYLDQLRDGGANLAGMYALQGGGWAPFHRGAFTAGSSIWNELNAEVTVRLFNREGCVEEIVTAFCARRGIDDAPAFLRLLALADEAIENGLYVRQAAEQAVYFRRVRIPPLTWIFWNNVTTSGLVGSLMRHLVRDVDAAIADGHRAVGTVEAMLDLARERNLPAEGLTFELDTLRILALAREVLFGRVAPDTPERLESLLEDYALRYPYGYRFDGISRDEDAWWLRACFPLLLRRRPGYRKVDHLLLSATVTRAKRWLAAQAHGKLPDYVDTQGMASDVLLR